MDGKGLADFRLTIQKMKDEEQRLGKTAYFVSVNPEELTEDDRDMYRRLMNGTLALEVEVFEAYRARVLEQKNASRVGFVGYIGNKLTIQMDKRGAL